MRIKSARTYVNGLICVAIISSAVSGCWGSAPTDTVSPLPVGGDNRQCTTTVLPGFSSKWPDLAWEFVPDRNCPLTVVASGASIPFNFRLIGNYGPGYFWAYSMYAVWNNQGAAKGAGNYYYFEQFSPTRVRSIITGNYSAATGSLLYQDSAVVIGYGGNHPPDYPQIFVKLPARVQAAAPSIVGDTYVVSDHPQNWWAAVSEEPTSYRYRWYLDGVLVSSTQGLTATLTEGPHTLLLEVRLSDETVQTEEVPITAVDCGGPYIC